MKLFYNILNSKRTCILYATQIERKNVQLIRLNAFLTVLNRTNPYELLLIEILVQNHDLFFVIFRMDESVDSRMLLLWTSWT